MRSFSELYDVEELKAQLPGIVEEIRKYQQDYEPQQGDVAYIIDTIAADWEDCKQPESIVDVFDLDIDPEDEWVWEAIEDAEWKLTEQAQEAINGALPENLGIGFGHAQFSADYGLILWHVEV